MFVWGRRVLNLVSPKSPTLPKCLPKSEENPRTKITLTKQLKVLMGKSWKWKDEAAMPGDTCLLFPCLAGWGRRTIMDLRSAWDKKWIQGQLDYTVSPYLKKKESGRRGRAVILTLGCRGQFRHAFVLNNRAAHRSQSRPGNQGKHRDRASPLHSARESSEVGG